MVRVGYLDVRNQVAKYRGKFRGFKNKAHGYLYRKQQKNYK